jgi:hypothetical protein
MMIEGMTRLYACPRVDILNGAGIGRVKTPVGAEFHIVRRTENSEPHMCLRRPTQYVLITVRE